MYFASILVKACIFCFLSTINDKIRLTPLTALESVFVMEIIQEGYGREEKEKDED